MTKPKSLVLLSGGMDSLVVLATALEESQTVHVLHLNYQQKTSAKEENCFDRISDFYKIPKENRLKVNMSFLKDIGGSSLTDKQIGVTNYQGDSKEIPSSYVPFRNSIILSLATSWGEVLKADRLYIGANHEDSPGYPDCRPEYYDAFNEVVRLGTKDGHLKIFTPVISMKKKEIVENGVKLKVPFELSWSCYAEEKLACGMCDSCALRLRGFKEANISDPLTYKEHL